MFIQFVISDKMHDVTNQSWSFLIKPWSDYHKILGSAAAFELYDNSCDIYQLSLLQYMSKFNMLKAEHNYKISHLYEYWHLDDVTAVFIQLKCCCEC